MATRKIIDPKGKKATPASARSGVGSGASIYSGRFTQSLLQDPDELRTPEQKHATYRVMSQTDAYIAEALRANLLPLMATALWEVAPPEARVVKGQRYQKPKAVKPKDLEAEETDPESETTSDSSDHARGEDMAQLLACNLLGQESDAYGAEYRMQAAFTQLIREIGTFLPHGFALFHRQYKAVGDKLVYKRLLWLEPQTISRWDINENDEFLGIFRQYRRANDSYVIDEYIPISELALFVWDITGTRLEGVPMLRSAFGPWKRKEFIQRCKMIALQQAGVGIPVATWDPEKWGSSIDNIKTFEDRIEEALQSSLGSGLGTAYLAVPNDSFKADYMRQEPGALGSFDKLGIHENLAEAHSGGTKSMVSGEQTMGSKNSASVHRSLEYVMTLAVATVIAEQMVTGVAGCRGLVQDLCDLNYATPKRYPQIVVSGVDPDEATRTLPMVKDLMSAGALKYRLAAEQSLWERCGVYLPDEEFDPENPVNQEAPPPVLGPDGLPIEAQPGGRPKPPSLVPPKRKPSPSGPRGGAPRVAKPSAQNRVETRGNKLGEDIREARRQTLRLGIESLLRYPSESSETAKSKGYRRAPTEFEARVCLLGQIQATLSNGGAALGATLLAAREAMIVDLISRMEQGKVNRRNLPGLRRSRPKGIAAYQQTLKDRWLDVALMGRQAATAELIRARDLQVPVGLADPPEEYGPYNQLPPGAPIPPGVQVPPWVREVSAQTLVSAVEAEAVLGVEIAIDELWARLLDEAINEYMRLSRTGIPETEVIKQVEALLRELSPKPELLVGRQLAEVAVNQGRDMAIKEAAQAGDTKYVVRSEVLDNVICEVCAGLDGVLLLVGTPEYEQLLPPALCLGGDSCRGFYIMLPNAVVEGEPA